MNAESDQSTMPRASRPLFQRLTYLAMSVLLAWHTFAMLVGPLPDSTISDAAREVLHPYATLFVVGNKWGFFAPNVNAGSHFSYEIEDTAGEKHTFTPEEDLNSYHPNFIWQLDRYQVVMGSPEVYGDTTGAALCLQHASLNPVTVTLFESAQKDFWPVDELNGEHPFSPGHVTVKTLRTVKCPGR
jgi:hypothetical protein